MTVLGAPGAAKSRVSVRSAKAKCVCKAKDRKKAGARRHETARKKTAGRVARGAHSKAGRAHAALKKRQRAAVRRRAKAARRRHHTKRGRHGGAAVRHRTEKKRACRCRAVKKREARRHHTRGVKSKSRRGRLAGVSTTITKKGRR